MHKGPSGHGLRGHEGLLCRFKRIESDDKMGIIALKTDLDSAIHILNYCLSSSSSPSVQSIFKYRIHCLKKKMLKTQKTVAVVSPLPILNSFACLEVEHVEDECTLDFPTPHVHNTIRKSQEGS